MFINPERQFAVQQLFFETQSHPFYLLSTNGFNQRIQPTDSTRRFNQRIQPTDSTNGFNQRIQPARIQPTDSTNTDTFNEFNGKEKKFNIANPAL